MDLLTQTSPAIMSSSKERFSPASVALPKAATIYRAGHIKCIENLELQTEMIIY